MIYPMPNHPFIVAAFLPYPPPLALLYPNSVHIAFLFLTL